MSTQRTTGRIATKALLRTTALAGAALLFVGVTTTNATPRPHGGGMDGSLTAHALREAGLREARADYWVNLSNCFNTADLVERWECFMEAKEELLESIGLAWDQYWARMDLVAYLGEDPYDPEIDPADFVVGVDNPYFPLIPGRTLVYEKDTDEGLEVVTDTVLAETKEILGVQCAVVHAVATLDGEVIEDTLDWYAQDVDGNVWYFGELSFEYEDGEPSSMAGSWKSGVDGGKPGIIMFADPVPGTVYRQEFMAAEAEDVGRIIALDETVTIDFGIFEHCGHTEDWSPIEPGIFEQKFYAPGIGVVLELDMDGIQMELVDILP